MLEMWADNKDCSLKSKIAIDQGKIMAHRHTIQGLVTGPAVIDSANTDLHWHQIAGEKTTTNTFIKGHIHHWRGIRTSTSIIMPGADNETNQ